MRKLECAGNELKYRIMGEGLPVVFLHDGILHSVGFEAVLEQLKERYLLITFDRPGYGQSPPPVNPISHVATLDDLLKHIGIERCILLGGSAGGSYAMDYTLTHPKKVAGLILVGSALSGFEFTDHMYTRGGRTTPGDSLEAWIKFWSDDPWLIAEENKQAKQSFSDILRTSPQNLEPYELETLDDILAIDRLSEIEVPCLIVIGESDIADNQAIAGILHHGLPDSRRVIVPKSGHLVYLEQPEHFSELVHDFLEDFLDDRSA